MREGGREGGRTQCCTALLLLLLTLHRCKLPQVSLDTTNSSLLLRKSVAAICSHAGYETSSTEALDALSGALGDFLSRFCQLLRINSDHQAEDNGLAFQVLV